MTRSLSRGRDVGHPVAFLQMRRFLDHLVIGVIVAQVGLAASDSVVRRMPRYQDLHDEDLRTASPTEGESIIMFLRFQYVLFWRICSEVENVVRSIPRMDEAEIELGLGQEPTGESTRLGSEPPRSITMTIFLAKARHRSVIAN